LSECNEEEVLAIYRTFTRQYFAELKTRPRTAADDCNDVKLWLSKEWLRPEMVTREELHSASWYEIDRASTASLELTSAAKTSEELVGDIHSDAMRWLEEARAKTIKLDSRSSLWYTGSPVNTT